MKTYEKVNVLSIEEIEKITADTIRLTVNERSHINAIENIAKLLLKEVEQYKNAVKEKFDHKKTDNAVVKITVSDYMDFNRTEFKENNPELYEQFKTLPIHKETVKIK